jgi:hypothetical protein
MATTNGSVTITTREQLPTGEMGSAMGADRLFGYFDEGRWLTPIAVDDRLIDNMLRIDGRAQTIAQVLTLPLRGMEWSIEPADGDSGEADWVIDKMTRPVEQGGMSTPFNLVLDQLTNATLYKRGYFEKVWTPQPDGTVTYGKLAYRPPASCQLATTTEGAPMGFRQRAWKGGSWVQVDIPAVKSMVHINQQHRRPLDGMSDVETAYALFEHRQKVRFLWYQGLENHALQKAIVKHPNSDDKAIQDLAQKVATLKSGGVVGIRGDQSVEPYPAGDMEGFVVAMNSLASEMAQSVLAGFVDLTSGETGTGSYALSKDATDLFLKSRTAALDEIATTVVHQAFAPLVRFNLGQDARVPLFKHGSLVQEASQVAVEMLQALATAPSMSVVPQAFLDELTEKVAGLLGLDVAKVKDAIEARAQQASTPEGQIMNGVDAAMTLVRQANIAPKPAPVGAAA